MKAETGPSTAPREWTIRKKRPEPFDTEFGSIVGPAADFPVTLVERASLDRVVEENERLREQLDIARGEVAEWHAQAEWERERYRQLRGPAQQAAMDALSWMPASVAKRYLEETSYKRLSAALQSGEGGTA